MLNEERKDLANLGSEATSKLALLYSESSHQSSLYRGSSEAAYGRKEVVEASISNDGG